MKGIFKNIRVVDISFILLLFSLSVYMRSPVLNGPIHDKSWVTAHVLMTVKIWNEESPGKFHFAPVYTRNIEGDRGAHALYGIKAADGRSYYVSYPPGTFVVPYYFLKITGIDFYEKGLRILNLFLHLLSGIFLYLLIRLVTSEYIKGPFDFFAISGVALCFLNTGPLIIQYEFFFSDILVQPLFLAGAFFFMKWRYTNRSSYYFIFLTLLMLGIYTEWIMVFLAFTCGLVVLFSREEWLAKFKYLSGITLVTLSVIFLIFFQYSSIAGWDALMEVWVKKYQLRSGMFGKENSDAGYSLTNPESWYLISAHTNIYLRGLYVFIVCTLLLGLLALIQKPSVFDKKNYRVLFVIAFPIVLHYLVFFNFNAVHDLALLKTLYLLFWLVPVFAFIVYLRLSWNLIAASFVMGLFGFYLTYLLPRSADLYFEQTHQMYHTTDFISISKFIRDNSRDDLPVYSNAPFCPQTFYLSGRMFRPAANLQEAKWANDGTGFDGFVFIDVNENSVVEVLP